MDTIIYLYHNRETDKFCIEKWQEKEYCLIRLGIPATLWQNLKTWEKEEIEGVKPRKRKRGFRSSGRRKRTVHPLLEELSVQQTALSLLGDNPCWTYCVYENFLWEKIDTNLWREYWKLPLFREYHDLIWAEELMKYGTWDSMIILGYASCVAELLYKYAGKLRSVKWILKPEQYTEAVQEFVEEVYEEYGLVISLQLLEANEHWAGVRLKTVIPVNVLDFTGEEKVSGYDLAAGSVWLDMDSLEGKEWRMRTRSPQIAYYSLKKQWAHLDTIGKNRYNT